MLVEANSINEAIEEIYEDYELFLKCLNEIKVKGYCKIEYGYNKPFTYKDKEDYYWEDIGYYELRLDEIISNIGCRDLIDFLLENIK